MGEIVSLSLLTSPCLELRENSKYIKLIENPKFGIKLLEILKMLQNFFLPEKPRLTPKSVAFHCKTARG